MDKELRRETWHYWFWVVPGLILTIVLRDELWWTNGMSWWALVYVAHAAKKAVEAKLEAQHASVEIHEKG